MSSSSLLLILAGYGAALLYQSVVIGGSLLQNIDELFETLTT